VKSMTRVWLLGVVASSMLLGAGCATTTMVVTEKPGAKVFNKDGKELGATPYNLEAKTWLWESTPLVVKQDGKQRDIEVKRSEIDILPTVGSACGFVLCFPAGIAGFLAGGMKFPTETKVDMAQAGPAAAPSAPAAPTTTSPPPAPAPATAQ
jgi:hypothetical protein